MKRVYSFEQWKEGYIILTIKNPFCDIENYFLSIKIITFLKISETS